MMMSLSIILFVICIILLIIISMSSISYTKNYNCLTISHQTDTRRALSHGSPVLP